MPQSSGQMMAAWSPAATPSLVWWWVRGESGGGRGAGGGTAQPRPPPPRHAGQGADPGFAAVDVVVDEVARFPPHPRPRLEALGDLAHHGEVAAGGEGLA